MSGEGGYYCITVHSVMIRHARFFSVAHIPWAGEPGFFEYKYKDNGNHVKIEEYALFPLAKFFCVPKERVEELVPRYRELYRGKRLYGKRLRMRILDDIYEETMRRMRGDIDILEVFRGKEGE